VVAGVLRVLAWPSAATAELAAAITRRLPRWLWEPYWSVTARRRHLGWELDLRDNVQRTLYFTGWYERRYLRWLGRQLRRGDVYVDAGAHIGIHALLLARHLLALGGGTVVAFEPVQEVAQVIVRTAERNGLPNVCVERYALGARRGEVDLRDDPSNFHAADAAVRSAYGPGDLVGAYPQVSLDDWLSASSLARIDVIKIDVEGAELEVLRGMARILVDVPPRAIGVEIRRYLLERAGLQDGELESFLERHGYALVPTRDLEGNYLYRRR
jgi:FkbM family methyltransferase